MEERVFARPPVMQSLLWKDSSSLRSLVLAIWCGIVLFHLIAFLASAWAQSGPDIDIYTCLWLLMPNLVALGAPAMLVGAEEESGTLNWLRTLPVSGNNVVDSKFLVALVGVLSTWLLASAVMWLVYQSWVATDSWITPVSRDLLSLLGITKSLVFTFTLLLTGFITAYLVRSPIAALLLLMPLVTIVSQAIYLVTGWIVTGRPTMVITARADGQWRNIVATIVVAVSLAALWFLQRYLGKRRLSAPAWSRPVLGAVDATGGAYRPPFAAGLARPGRVAALLWQQGRQVALPASVLTAMALLFMLSLHLIDPWRHRQMAILDFAAAFAFPVVIMTSSWLGSLVFYGDSLRRRCNFFSDRGISSGQIWWTRILWPGTCCLVLLLVSLTLPNNGLMHEMRPYFWIFIIVSFAFGQLVAQWAKRPVLALFAAPAYLLIASLPLTFAYSYYPQHLWTFALTAPLLLFATWRLCGRWLEGRIDVGFHVRVVAYTALAVAVSLGAIVADRMLTTPPLRPEWRAKAVAVSNEFYRATPAQTSHSITREGISTSAYWPYAFRTDHLVALDSSIDLQQMALSVREELASETIGDAIGVNGVLMVLHRNLPRGEMKSDELAELKRNAVAVLLKWSRTIREKIIRGESRLYFLERIAEPAEAYAIEILRERPYELGSKADIRQLVTSIPSDQLRFQSRKRALLSEWRRYQDDDWNKAKHRGYTFWQKHFMGYLVADHIGSIWYERRRTDRCVDEATRITWSQLENGLPEFASAEEVHRTVLWNNIFYPRLRQSYRHEFRSLVGLYWTSDQADAVDELRGRYAVRPNAQ